MAKPRKTGKKYKPKITLYPLTIEEALKKAMETKLPKKPTKKPSLSQIQGRPGAEGVGG